VDCSTDCDGWQEVLVEDCPSTRRVDVFLSDHLESLSRAWVQKFFTQNGVFVNGLPVKKNFLLKAGDVVRFFKMEPGVTGLNPVCAPIDIIFEDESIIVVNKQAGLVTHAGNGIHGPTLVEMVMAHCPLSGLGGELRPGVVHRLDKETSGVMVFAKTDRAYLSLIKQFSNHRVKKRYVCIVDGNFPIKTGIINEPIGRSRSLRTCMCVTPTGRDATTIWDLRDNFKTTALLSVNIITGRTHQIRVHMSHIRHPILGDSAYGYVRKKGIPECDRVMLHAMNLELTHPISNEQVSFFSDFPDDFATMIDRLSKDADG
jgi:23S rRNA pseudouridine1911/1915/1917 synthase